MLVAYLDEVGETGAFISRDHPRFKTSPAFGYAGFILPDGKIREFGATFVDAKRRLFSEEIHSSDNPERWEKKGADLIRPHTLERYPQNIRVLRSLIRTVGNLGGAFFFYAHEKPLGTPKQVKLDPEATEKAALQETLNRLCTFADGKNQNLMVIFDQINETSRRERTSRMYAHIFSRSAEHSEMKRILEPPMHLDSSISANIQFADWFAATVFRAVDNQILRASPYAWLPRELRDPLRGTITHESKLRLWQSSMDDIHHIHLFDRERPLFASDAAYRLTDRDPDTALKLQRIKSSIGTNRDARATKNR